jgi:hypothetical protein
VPLEQLTQLVQAAMLREFAFGTAARLVHFGL